MKYPDLKSIVSVLCLCCSLEAAGQLPLSLDSKASIGQYAIDIWTTEHGLPNNAIMDVAKSPDGFIWLATFNGLVRFDGLEFTVFDRNNTDAFKTNNLADLFIAADSSLWIGTNGGGLVKYHNNVFQHIDTDSLIGSNTITSLSENRKGTLWFGTKNGLGKIEDQVISAVQNPLINHANIYTMYVDTEDLLWVGTTLEGLFRYDGQNMQRITTEQGLNSNSIRSIFQDREGHLWIGMDQGVNKINLSGVKLEDSILQNVRGFVNAILPDAAGDIWLGTSLGLFKNGNTLEKITTKEGLSHNIIQSLMYDDEDNLWLGTYRGGLNRLKPSKFLWMGVYEGLPHEVINVTYQDNEITWIGTDNGLVKLSEGKSEIINLGRRNNNRIRDIMRDSRNRLWVCTYGGLVHLENDKIKKRYTTGDGLVSNSVRRIAESIDSSIWVATASGLSKFEHGNWKTYGQGAGLIDPFIMSLLVSSTNEFWVGTDGGGMYRFTGDSFNPVNDGNGYIGDIIFSIDEDDKGALWIGTNTGLIRYQNGNSTLINRQDGLISNSVFQTFEDHSSHLWIYTDKGVMRLPKEQVMEQMDGKTSMLENAIVFDESDGMQTSQITPASISSQSPNGYIWIPTIKGVAIIDGDNIPVNEVAAIPKILSISGDNNIDYPLTDFVLPAGNLRLEINYTGLSYYAPEDVRFKYKLESFDEEWIDVGDRRVAFYTNLSPGKYQFLVAASNDDGLWNDAYASVVFKKEAFFYQEKWFYAIIGLALFFLGGLVYFWRVRELRKRNQYLTTQVTQRTLDIQKQNDAISRQSEKLGQLNSVKDKLFSVISHDLRGPIAALGGVLGLMNSGQMTEEELDIHLAKLDTEINGLTNLIDNLLSWAKSQMHGISPDPEDIHLVDLLNENLSIYVSIAEVKGIAISQSVSPKHHVYSDRNMLNLVIRNLLMNAIKFTPKGGQIKVSSKLMNDQVEITVEDNGIGMSDEEVKSLFNVKSAYTKMGTSKETGTGLGLLLCKEFVERNHGNIWVETNPGSGSKFKFRLKSGNIPDQVDVN